MTAARTTARPLVASLFTLTLILTVRPAEAQERPRARDIHFTMGGGLPVNLAYLGAGAGATLLGTFVIQPPSEARMGPLDGLGHRAINHSAATASDVVLLGGMAGSIAMSYVLERAGAGSRGLNTFRAPLILGESALMAVGMVSLLKNVVGECRPRAWSDNEQRCLGSAAENRLSFPSGHTAPLAAMAGASLGMYLFPSGRRPEFLPLLAVTGALAGTNLALRVVAGAHSWVDTSTAFVLGSGVGLFTAWLHTRTTAPVSAGVMTGSTTGLTLSGTF